MTRSSSFTPRLRNSVRSASVSGKLSAAISSSRRHGRADDSYRRTVFTSLMSRPVSGTGGADRVPPEEIAPPDAPFLEATDVLRQGSATRPGRDLSASGVLVARCHAGMRQDRLAYHVSESTKATGLALAARTRVTAKKPRSDGNSPSARGGRQILLHWLRRIHSRHG